MPNRVLMVAFHYPPCVGSSGLQRTLCFSKYLPKHGWEPLILSAHPRAYPQKGDDQLGDIPSSVIIERAFALDTVRHVSIGGRYVKRMALPDRWVSWVLGAVPAGLRLIKRYRPKVLWTTYPIASAHIIGFLLHRLTKIPWVIDFRDPMTEGEFESPNRFPSDAGVWRANRWIEREVATHCSRAVFVTPSAERMYVERYPRLRGGRSVIIPNGYDELSFASVEARICQSNKCRESSLLLHSGALYSGLGDRHPGVFLSALGRLAREGVIDPSRLKVILRASGHEEEYAKLIRQNSLDGIVFLEPSIPYQDALAEMLCADGLLLFQGANCNPNIPAKLYEYFRARRPIFAMTDPNGDTAALLRSAGVESMVALQSESEVAEGLLEFLEEVERGKAVIADAQVVQRFSRESGAQELARVLDAVSGSVED